MKNFFRFLLLSYPTLANAQYEQILKNPDVIWAAELDVEYFFEPYLTGDSVPNNDFFLLKNYNPKPAEWHEGERVIFEKMMAAANAGDWEMRRFHDMSQTLSIYDIDSTFGLIFDPETLEGTVFK